MVEPMGSVTVSKWGTETPQHPLARAAPGRERGWSCPIPEHRIQERWEHFGSVLFFSFPPGATRPTAQPDVSRRCQLLVHKCILGGVWGWGREEGRKRQKKPREKKKIQFITCNHIYKYINIYIKRKKKVFICKKMELF